MVQYGSVSPPTYVHVSSLVLQIRYFGWWLYLLIGWECWAGIGWDSPRLWDRWSFWTFMFLYSVGYASVVHTVVQYAALVCCLFLTCWESKHLHYTTKKKKKSTVHPAPSIVLSHLRWKSWVSNYFKSNHPWRFTQHRFLMIITCRPSLPSFSLMW